MLKGKVLQQHDLIQFLGSSKEATDFNKTPGQTAYWTNSMFGGMPTYQIALGYPKSAFVVGWIYSFFVKAIPHPINSLLFYMIGFYLLLASYRLNKWICVIGAIAFAFSSYNIVILAAGHVNKSYAIAFAPFVLAALNYIFTSKKYLLGSALFALAFVTEFKANHIQITYYLLILIGFYMVYQLYQHIKEKEISGFLKGTAGMVVGMLLAVGANFTNIYLTNEYSKQTIRGKAELKQKAEAKSEGIDKDYALDWSYGKSETGTIMIPDFKGGSSAAVGEKHPKLETSIEQSVWPFVASLDEYWGPQPSTSGPVYFGAIMCFLFVLGLLTLKGAERWWILGACLLSIVLSWGKNFMPLTNFFFDYFPFYNKFRSVSMTLVIASIAFPILALLVLDQILKSADFLKANMRNFYIALGATGGLCLLLYIAPGMAGDFLKSHDRDKENVINLVKDAEKRGYQNHPPEVSITAGLQDARQEILKGDALRSFFFIALSGAALWLFGTGRLKKEMVMAGIGVMVLLDMSLVSKRYLKDEEFKTKARTQQDVEATPADLEILQDKDPNYRVLNLTAPSGPFNDASTSYYHKSIGGYHGAKLRRIQDLISNKIWPDVNRFFMNPDSGAALNMLNTKYVIYQPDQNHPNGVYRNPAALGNAWFIKDITIAKTADEEMNTLKAINPKDHGVVLAKFSDYFKDHVMQWQQGGSIKLDKYSPNELNYSYSAPADGFVTFSEIYYNPNVDIDWHKGDWQAYLDGKEVDHIRIDYVLRGMKVPAGQHKIDFKFVPHSYFMGENISLASSILILLLVAGSIFMEVKKGKEDAA